MIAFVTHSSALWFIRRYGSLVSCADSEPFARVKCAVRTREIEPSLFEKYGFAKPLHIAYSSESVVRRIADIRYHRMPALPLAAFRRIDSTLAIASPEFVFLQMAGQHQLPRLVLLGFELCGAYSLNRGNVEGFVQHEPLTSVKGIEAFLSEMELIGNARHIGRARRALRFISDNSFSPKESEIAVLLCLPQMEGGFGLPLPAMNYEIQLSKEAQKLYPVSHCKADLCWPVEKLCVEYDSDAIHATVEHLNADSARRNALETMGFRVVAITKSQLYSSGGFEEVARLIAKRVGKRVQIRSNLFPEKHAELRMFCGLTSRY